MAQKTKEELKNQSSELLETEGTFNTDLIDSLATEADVNKVYEHIYHPTGTMTTLQFRRQGNFVSMTGTFRAAEDIHRADSLGIEYVKGYWPGEIVLGKLLFYVDDAESNESIVVSGTTLCLGKIGAFNNQTNETILKGKDSFIDCVYYTSDPFPDDSEIINPIPDKK